MIDFVISFPENKTNVSEKKKKVKWDTGFEVTFHLDVEKLDKTVLHLAKGNFELFWDDVFTKIS